MEKRIKTAVILAAGSGIRLRPKTYNIPKGFVEVGGQTLIERSLKILQVKGIKNIIIGCGHLSKLYEGIQDQYNFEIYKNVDYKSSGSLYTLVLAEKIITNDFLILESDILYEPRAIEALVHAEEENLILASGATNSDDEVYIEADDDMRFITLSKDKSLVNKVTGELVGITKISKNALSSLCDLVRADEQYKHWDYERGFTQILNKHNFFVRKIDDLVWCEIDNEKHLKRAKELIYPKLVEKA
ncbi:phosphocholine cytidylyltransferase family protein [Reichenbachiella sp. MALMAid0571]|uniref:phosphocholine cytidylyltransferase family protein n=1 Tax=Reichenbachiella sp. MALMAid0571 TaxID=3143939 RepID=UPI0032DFAEB3